MSWEEKLEFSPFLIRTGDGKRYKPKWKTGETSVEFNTSIFNFIDVPGSLVERKQPKANKYPLTFWFDGADNVDNTQAFMDSANDNRIWEIDHPFYGKVKGHPVSITRNDVNLNITEITVEFWESIDVDYPNANFSVKDNSLVKRDNIVASSGRAYATSNVLSSADIVKNKESITATSSVVSKLADAETASTFQNDYADAMKAMDNLLPSPLNAIFKAQTILLTPSGVNVPVLERLKAYIASFERLGKVVYTLADKYFFQTQGATTVASYANASVNPIEGDYETIRDVETASAGLLTMYNEYIKVLDEQSVSIYDTENTFQPDATVQKDLYDLVMYTVGNLFNLGFDSQQERIVYTDKDTNLILLAHKYFGLDVDDENLERFRLINNIRLDELLKIKKGRKIIYYV